MGPAPRRLAPLDRLQKKPKKKAGRATIAASGSAEVLGAQLLSIVKKYVAPRDPQKAEEEAAKFLTQERDAAELENKSAAGEHHSKDSANPLVRRREMMAKLSAKNPVSTSRKCLMGAASPDVRSADGKGWAPLHYACHNSAAVLVSLLLSHGADPNVQNSSGTSPLQLAALVGSFDCTLLLLGCGAHPDLTSGRMITWSANPRRGLGLLLSPKLHVIAISPTSQLVLSHTAGLNPHDTPMGAQWLQNGDVYEVTPGSPAARAGLRAGLRLTECDHTTMYTSEKLKKQLAKVGRNSEFGSRESGVGSRE